MAPRGTMLATTVETLQDNRVKKHTSLNEITVGLTSFSSPNPPFSFSGPFLSLILFTAEFLEQTGFSAGSD